MVATVAICQHDRHAGAALAREIGLEYASLSLVANWAAGCGDAAEISLAEIFANLEHATAQLPPIIAELLA